MQCLMWQKKNELQNAHSERNYFKVQKEGVMESELTID